MVFQQHLNNLVALKLIRRDAKDVKCLSLGHEAAFDPESFFSNLFPALVAKFLHLTLHSLSFEEL